MPAAFNKGNSSLAILLALLVVVMAITALKIFPQLSSRLTMSASKNIVSPCTTQQTAKVLDFRTGLDGNYRENLVLLLAASRRVYDSDPNANDALKALDDNAWDLGWFLQNFFTPEIGKQFTSLWQEQDNAFMDYTLALKRRDDAAKSEAESKIKDYIMHKTDFWKKLLPGLDTNRYQRLAVARTDSIKSAINAYSTRDVTKSFKEQHAAYQQTGQVADLISSEIVKEQPQKFNQ